MTIIDTHAHLDHLENLDEVLMEADQAGVNDILSVSMDLESCKKNLEIFKTSFQSGSFDASSGFAQGEQSGRRSRPLIHLAMGIHPSEAYKNELERCVDLIRENAACLTAIGEIGLDFWYKWVRKDQEKKDEQIKVFRALLKVAKELDLPVSIHSRGAWRECLDMTREVGIKRAVFHWYSGPIDVLENILRCGYYVSATPSIAGSEHAREAMKHAPIEQTLIETDTPVYYKLMDGTGDGFQSTPKDVLRTLKAYCDLKQTNEKEALDILNNNARELFRVK